MQKEFKLPSQSVLAKLKSGGVDNIKTLVVLKANGSTSEDVILYDEIYLQQCDQYSRGRVEGSDANDNLRTRIVCYIIIELKSSGPYVIRAVPRVNLSGGWLKDELELTLIVTIEFGFP